LASDKHELPKNIERYLAALSRLYAQDGRRAFQEIIVNAKIRIVEEWTFDNWNGGTYGHALYLVIPESLFLAVAKAKTRDEIQSAMCRDLNDLHNLQNESIAEVFLEMDDVTENGDWRQESGLLKLAARSVAPDGVKRIWGDEGFRLFLSHKAEVKKETAALKERLGLYGISAFVAHEDIRPTKAWQDEIENGLASMDAFAALLTDNFHDSYWTDQEVGFALAREVPVIAVEMGRLPYGFIGKFQALRADWDTAADGIVKLLIHHDRMFSAYVHALRNCPNWDEGNVLARVLPAIEAATEQQIDELIVANNDNTEVRYCFGFRGNKSSQYGDGLISHLHRLGSRRFVQDSNANVVPAAQVKRRQTVEDEIPF
jgi:TIR domain